ncbi:hypothetical protein KBC99_00495 [Candidatus Saccharibacteria bacterium]|nr:hypothetical protein [Candidatus Saccharibacteria bacterium]
MKRFISALRNIWRRLQKSAQRHPIWIWYLSGCLYYLYTISWMFGLKTAEIAQGWAVKAVAVSAGLIMVASFAIGFAIFGFFVKRSKVSLSNRNIIWLAPAAWVVSEYLRSVLFSIISLGPGGKVGPFWVFGNAGYFLVDTPLVYAARWGGLYLLGFIVIAIIAAALHTHRSRNYRPLGMVFVLAGILSLSGWFVYRTPTGPQRDVVALQFSSEFAPDKFSLNGNQMLDRLPAQSVDVLVLPEYSRYWEVNPEADTQSVSRIMKNPNGVIIDSTHNTDNGLGYNLVTYHAVDGQHAFTQRKWFAIPAGEYVPYIYQVILAYAGQESLLLHFQEQKSIDPGTELEKPYEFNGVRYGALACSGAIAPELYRGMTVRGAEVLSNSASLDTMGISQLYHLQARTMARLHAVANARPFLQSARGGLSFIIDHNGRFLAQSQARDDYELLQGQVQANTVKTLYTLLGDWVVILSAAGLVAYWLLRRKNKKS